VGGRIDFQGHCFQKLNVKKGESVRRIVDDVFARSIAYGGRCNVVMSIRWEAREEFGGDSHEFDHIFSGMNVSSVFAEFDGKGALGGGGAVSGGGRVASRQVSYGKPLVSSKEKSLSQKGGEVYAERIPKLRPRAQSSVVSVSPPVGVKSNFGVGGMGAAYRELQAKEKQRQVSFKNRRALLARSSVTSGARALSFGSGGRLPPSGKLMKVEEMQRRGRERMRDGNRSSFVGGSEARRRSVVKGTRRGGVRD